MAVVASEGLMGVMEAKGVVAEMVGAAHRAEMRRVQRSSRTPPAALPTRLRLCKLVAAAAAVVAEGAVAVAAAASANAASGHEANGHEANGHEASADGADESSANAASANAASADGGHEAAAASAMEAVASCSAEGCCRRGSAPCWFYRTRRSSGTEGMGLS